MDEDVRVFQLGQHSFRVGDEVGADIAAVELHAFDDVEQGLQALRFLDRDDAFVADLLHRLGQHAADCAITVGRNGRDLSDLVVCRNLPRAAPNVLPQPPRPPYRCRA